MACCGGKAAAMLWSSSMERPMWWGTEVCQQSCLWAWKKGFSPRPNNLPVEPSDERIPLTDSLTAASRKTWTRGTQLSCPWTPNPQKLWDNKYWLFAAIKFWSNLLTKTNTMLISIFLLWSYIILPIASEINLSNPCFTYEESEVLGGLIPGPY